MLVAAEFGSGQVFWSMLWFFMFFIWIWLLIIVFSDIFRSQDLSGWGKALWSIFVIVLPYLGVFVYLIARGHKMNEHAAAAGEAAAGRRSASTCSAAVAGVLARRRARQARRPQGEGRHRRRRVRAPQGQVPRVSDGATAAGYHRPV